MEVIPIKLSYDLNGQVVVLHPSIIRDAEKIWLVDCGYEGSLPMIKHELSQHGLGFADLHGIIISHDDIDHLGGLKEIKDEFPSIKVYASEIETPYVSGSLRSLRLQQAEDIFPCLPEEHKAWAIAFQEQLRAIKRVPVDRSIGFDEAISENIQIVNTPGHTPGHISIYLPKQRTLIANDAVVFENGELGVANPQFCLDLPEAENSIKKIAALDIDVLICYHGGTVSNDVKAKLLGLTSGYK